MLESKMTPELKKTIPWQLVVIFVIFSSGIVLTGIFYYKSLKNRVLKEQENNLLAIASLKIGQIESWHKERLGDATVIGLDKPFIRSTEDLFYGKNKVVKAELYGWIKSVRNEYDYSNVLLADSSFKVRLSVTLSDTVLGASIKKEMKAALTGHNVIMTDLHRSKEVPYIHIDVLVPLFDSVNKKPIAVGFALLRIDPGKVLFPLIQSWPTSSRSSETLIVRKDGDSVLYLNELRHIPNTAMKMKVPFSDKNFLSSKAVSGFEGVVEGVDYRKVPVIGYLTRIDGFPWYMVAKVDKEEILSPLHKYVLLIVIVVILLVLINASIFGFWIWTQQINLYRKQVANDVKLVQADNNLRKSEKLFRELFENMLNGFAYCKMLYEEGLPPDFLYVNVNDAFESLTGLKDVKGKKVSEVIPGIQEADQELLERYNRVSSTGIPEVFETYVESLKMWFAISVYSPQKGYFVAVFDVITTRKLAEEKLQETNEYLSNLFNYANAPIIVWDTSLIITRFNHAFEGLSGYSAVEVIGKKIDMLFPKNEVIPSLSLTNKAISGERWETVEIEIQRKDGESRIVLWNSANIHSKDGKTIIATIAQGHDITVRKQAENSLKESEILLQNIIDNSNSLIYIVDTEGRFIHVNQPLLKLLSSTPDKLIGQTREAYLPKAIADEHRMNELVVIKTGKTQVFEEENIEPDGKHFYLTTKFPLFNNQNEIYGVGGLSTDITERKNIEKILKESEERFRSLYENITIGIYRTTADGRILLANPALISMLGFDSFEQLANRNLEKEGYEPDYPRSKFLETIERQGIILGLESAWNRQNGDVLYVRESAKAVRDARGNMLYYDGTVEDITDRKKVEEALRESEDKFKYIFDHSVIAKSITLPSGEISVNRSFCDMLGYTRDELERTKWQDISHPDDIKLTEKMLNTLISGEKNSARFIKRYLHKNGSIVWTDVGTALRRDKNGKPLYFMTAIIDITERKRSEETINELNEELELKIKQRTELLEAANKELEAFTYSVSHDLRAPLRSVHGYTKILVEEYENKLDEEGKRICGVISSSATQMGELIDDLLSFSRIGRTSMNPSQLEMKSIVKSVFEEICPYDQKSKTNLKAGKLHKAFGDASLLRLVWTNLISNAIKYSSKESISEISVGSQLKYDRIIYSVKDNGVGFDMKYKHKLFGVFQRLHSGAEFEGNGVGLAIVQRIILKHGGKVWAESEVGKGATFYFSLPVQDKRRK